MVYTTTDWIWFSYVILICIFAIIGNGLVCHSIYADKKSNTVYRLIASQCLSDFIFGFACLLRFVVCSSAFIDLGRLALVICELNALTITGSFFVSSIAMTAIAIERYLKICSSKPRLYAWYGQGC